MNRSGRIITQSNLYDNRFLAAIILLLFIRPTYIKETGFWFFFRAGMVLAAVLVLALFVSEHGTKYKAGSLLICSFFAIIVFSTIYNGGNLVACLETEGIMLAACLFFDLWLQKSPETLLKSSFVFDLVIYINLATLFLYPNGMYASKNYRSNWFLGFNNTFIRVIIPGICMSLLYSYKMYGKMTIRTKLLILASFITVFKVRSATSILGLAFFCLLFFLVSKFDYKRILRFINLYTGTAALIVVAILIVLQNKIHIFSFLIETVLHKDLSMTGRTAIWSRSLECFLEHPIIGYGYLQDVDYQVMLNYRLATHPHNFWLYQLITGGCVLLADLILIIRKSAQKLKSSHTIYSKIIMCGLLSFFLMGISESLVSTNVFWPMFVLAMNVDAFEDHPKVQTAGQM